MLSKTNSNIIKFLFQFVFRSLVLLIAIQDSSGEDFVLSSTLNGGIFPVSVATADINGDGKVDLISASINDHKLVLLTNNANGNFAFTSEIILNANPDCVTTADVNGDGKPDLITSCDGSPGKIIVLSNDGGGNFAFSSEHIVGNRPFSVTTADVNGDGKIDLICANFNDDNVTVLTNNGFGSFALDSSHDVGWGPHQVIAVDVNGDGKVDLVTANEMANNLSVLTNDGSGGFALSSSLLAGHQPESVVAADINGDGKVDLIGANNLEPTFSVFTNNGSGCFVLSSTPAVATNWWEATLVCVVAADVNGDNKMDLIGADEQQKLFVLTNDGSGHFAVSFAPVPGHHPYCVIAQDINGDGKVDLISASHGGIDGAGYLTVWTNQIEFPQPHLNITVENNHLIIFYPQSAGNHNLQSTTNLTFLNWVSATDAVPLTNYTNNSIPMTAFTVTNDSAARFFRLQ